MKNILKLSALAAVIVTANAAPKVSGSISAGTAGFGAGLDYKVNKKFSVGVSADYMNRKFKGSSASKQSSKKTSVKSDTGVDKAVKENYVKVPAEKSEVGHANSLHTATDNSASSSQGWGEWTRSVLSGATSRIGSLRSHFAAPSAPATPSTPDVVVKSASTTPSAEIAIVAADATKTTPSAETAVKTETVTVSKEAVAQKQSSAKAKSAVLKSFKFGANVKYRPFDNGLYLGAGANLYFASIKNPNATVSNVTRLAPSVSLGYAQPLSEKWSIFGEASVDYVGKKSKLAKAARDGAFPIAKGMAKSGFLPAIKVGVSYAF